jgi:alcohol dehydrogenase (cytochrome c)
MKKTTILISLLTAPLLFGQILFAQGGGGLDPADLMKPLSDQWPSYSGDNTGKRYSALKQVNTSTVKNLSLRWINTGITTACGPDGTGANGPSAPPPAAGGGGGGRGGRGGGGGASATLIVGGFGNGSANNCAPTMFSGGILAVDGVLYGASDRLPRLENWPRSLEKGNLSLRDAVLLVERAHGYWQPHHRGHRQ